MDFIDPAYFQDMFGLDFRQDIELMQTLDHERNDLDIISNIKDMDFITFNPIINLGGISILIFMIFTQIIILLVMKGVTKLLVRRYKQKKEEAAAAHQAEGGDFNSERYSFIRLAKELYQTKSKIKVCAKLCGRMERKNRSTVMWNAPLMVSMQSTVQ